MRLIYVAFFLSGFPALIYQLIWQRSLFTIYGVNIESITVVVTAFMVGLGVGSLAGGAISKIKGVNPLVAFGIFELGIGLFGLISPMLFEFVGERTLGASSLQTFLITFALVLLPTLLMGATLPLLVVHLVRRFNNVGVSVGLLYFVNTLGAAVVCFLAVIWLFGAFGKSGTFQIAAGINFVVGGVALFEYWRNRGATSAAALATAFQEKALTTADSEGRVSPGNPESSPPQLAMSFPLALIVVTVIGYISLSYEILWVRVFSFLLSGMAAAFPLLLGAFLFGIAGGSLMAHRYCRNVGSMAGSAHMKSLAYFVLLANMIAFFVVPAMAELASLSYIAFAISLIFVALGAALLGATLPLISHFAVSPDDKVGARLSYLYLANIVGSAAGSLITGFVLMDRLGLQSIALFVTLLGLALGAALLFASGLQGATLWARVGAAAVTGAVAALITPTLFDRTYEKLLFKTKITPETRFARVIETKSGVITVTQDGTIFGGGVYDGHFNTDIVKDENLIIRAYFFSALHPSPKRVLMVGLASGSWAQVFAHHPALESMTVVEINPGYMQLMGEYPEVASLLKNPKVKIEVDDGRRWLSRHPQEKFDAIVMNTSFVWRAHATSLLSREFLEQVKVHLRPGGIVFYNTGNHPEVQKTASIVYKDVVRVYNFIAASDSPITVDKQRWIDVLAKQKIDGRPVLPNILDDAKKRRMDFVYSRAENWGNPKPGQDPNDCCFIENRDSIVGRTRNVSIVTEDNMYTEWPRLFTREMTFERLRDRLRGKAVGL